MQQNYWGNTHEGEERQGDPLDHNAGLTSVIRRGGRKEVCVGRISDGSTIPRKFSPG